MTTAAHAFRVGFHLGAPEAGWRLCKLFLRLDSSSLHFNLPSWWNGLGDPTAALLRIPPCGESRTPWRNVYKRRRRISHV